MDVENIINEFLLKFYKSDEKLIEGVIFYGSYQTKTNSLNSDVDLLILYSSKEDTIKGYKNFKDLNFEYFERSLSNIYQRIEFDFNNYEDTLLSVIGYGKILYDKNNNLVKLKNYVLNKYKNGLPKLTEEDKLYYLKKLNKSINTLDQMHKCQNPYYSNFYAITLDQIRDYYNKANGFSNMSTSKVYKLYTDNKMRFVQHKSMPDEQFINQYLNCIKTQNIEDIENIFQHITKDISTNIDFDNIRLNIGNKKH